MFGFKDGKGRKVRGRGFQRNNPENCPFTRGTEPEQIEGNWLIRDVRKNKGVSGFKNLHKKDDGYYKAEIWVSEKAFHDLLNRVASAVQQHMTDVCEPGSIDENIHQEVLKGFKQIHKLLHDGNFVYAIYQVHNLCDYVQEAVDNKYHLDELLKHVHDFKDELFELIEQG